MNYLLASKFSDLHYSLPALSNYPFIIRYGYSTMDGTQILTVTKNGDKYFIQLIEDIPDGIPPFYEAYYKPYYKITEKVLTEEQVNRILETIKDLRCIPGELETSIIGSSLSYFGLYIKMGNDVIYFSGIPGDSSYFGKDINSVIRKQNKQKMKVLDFVGFLLRAGGVFPNKKVIYSDRTIRLIGDSVRYNVSLFRITMVREIKVYFDEKLIANSSYFTEIKLPYADTLPPIEDRVKIKTLEWDNMEMEY